MARSDHFIDLFVCAISKQLVFAGHCASTGRMRGNATLVLEETFL